MAVVVVAVYLWQSNCGSVVLLPLLVAVLIVLLLVLLVLLVLVLLLGGALLLQKLTFIKRILKETY